MTTIWFQNTFLESNPCVSFHPFQVKTAGHAKRKIRKRDKCWALSRHNSRIWIHAAWLSRYSSKWLRRGLRAPVSWNPQRGRTANMLVLFHSIRADGYDMDYTDSKSIRPRSWVYTGLVNCPKIDAFFFSLWGWGGSFRSGIVPPPMAEA